MQPGDDIYSSAPVQYVKLDRLPSGDDTSPLIQALMRGDSFVTSGEVLIPSYTVGAAGRSGPSSPTSSGRSRSTSSR